MTRLMWLRACCSPSSLMTWESKQRTKNHKNRWGLCKNGLFHGEYPKNAGWLIIDPSINGTMGYPHDLGNPWCTTRLVIMVRFCLETGCQKLLSLSPLWFAKLPILVARGSPKESPLQLCVAFKKDQQTRLPGLLLPSL